MIDFDCIILAAGESTRMKKWKMILPLKDSTIIEESVKNASKVCKRIILVTGYNSNRLKDIFKDHSNISIVENSNYKDGMFSSIQTGVKAVESEYFFITHGDLPFIEPEIYKTLIEDKGEEAIFPEFNGKKGHPVLLSKKLINKILNDKKSKQMKEFLINYPKKLIPVNTDSIYKDIDTDKDYKKHIYKIAKQ